MISQLKDLENALGSGKSLAGAVIRGIRIGGLDLSGIDFSASQGTAIMRSPVPRLLPPTVSTA